jgi:16S rRNA (adenine(1408)-N(1))-methyltransferase
VVVDLGTGDGRAVLARAAAEPRSLVVGIDASAAAMAESSRRAARRGSGNALFVVASAERVPPELCGVAGATTVLYPWGSLLRGALALDESAAAGIASLLATGSALTIALSIDDRDGLDLPSLAEPGSVAGLAARWSAFGLDLDDVRPAGLLDDDAAASTWARRLASDRNRHRAAWRIVLRRPGRSVDERHVHQPSS